MFMIGGSQADQRMVTISRDIHAVDFNDSFVFILNILFRVLCFLRATSCKLLFLFIFSNPIHLIYTIYLFPYTGDRRPATHSGNVNIPHQKGTNEADTLTSGFD